MVGNQNWWLEVASCNRMTPGFVHLPRVPDRHSTGKLALIISSSHYSHWSRNNPISAAHQRSHSSSSFLTSGSIPFALSLLILHCLLHSPYNSSTTAFAPRRPSFIDVQLADTLVQQSHHHPSCLHYCSPK